MNRFRMTQAEKAEIQKEIDALTDEWWDAWATFDWEKGLTFVHDEPETTWCGGPKTLYSLQGMRTAWPTMVAGLARQDLDFTNARTVVLAPDLVWTLREANYTVTDDSGAIVSEGQFMETAVWAKRDGRWKLLIGHDDECTPKT